MVRVHCDPPGRKPEWGLPEAKAESRETLKEEKPEREEPQEAGNRKDESPEEESLEEGSERKEPQKGSGRMKIRKERPTRCEKALKEMEISERGDSHRGESPKYLENCTVK